MNESSSGRIPASACRIKTHNLHLLLGDKTDQAGSMDQNALRSQSAGSNSSEDSRQMDQSPTGNHSDDSLEAEIKYQEELKERLRASFADLGMNPEGVLMDSLDEGDMRDSLDEPNQLRREVTFVRNLDDQGDNHPQFQDSLDASQESINNNDDDLSLHDSLDGTQDKTVPITSDTDIMPNHSSEPTSQEIKDYGKKDNHLVAHQTERHQTQKIVRQSSGVSLRSNNSGSKPGSRRNSRDSGNHSPKVTSRSTLVRLKDSPSHRKSPSEQQNSSIHNSSPNMPYSREATPADDTKQQHTQTKAVKADSKLNPIENVDKVRVEYISDDSGDEDMHFVDEKGSPVDNFGLPLDDARKTHMQRQYRIKKPAPPKEPSPRDQQIVNSRRTSAGKLSRTTSRTKIENDELGLLDSLKIQNSQLVKEPVATRTKDQQLGVMDYTLPSNGLVDSPSNQVPFERLDSSKSSNKRPNSSNKNNIFGDVHVSSNTRGGEVYNIQDGPSKKHGSTHINGGSGNNGHNNGSKQHTSRDSDPYNDLRFDMDAVKRAAAEQEAALRLQNNSKGKQRTYSPPHFINNRNNSGDTDKKQDEQKVNNVDPNARKVPTSAEQLQHQQPFVDNSSVPDEINQYPSPSTHPQYLSRDHQWLDSGQYSGSGGQLSWQQDNGNPPGRQPQARVAITQPSPQGMIQPLLSQGQPGGQFMQSPSPREYGQFFKFEQPPQQIYQPMGIGYKQPMQLNTEPANYSQALPQNQQHPAQSAFEPSLSYNYQQPDMMQSMHQSQQWLHPQQVAGYPVQPPQQQFQPSQPPNMYAGQYMQGSGHFNQGFNQVMQQQQQFVEQYPNMTQSNVMEVQAPESLPNQMNQQYGGGPRMSFSQPITQRQIKSGPVFSRLPREQPIRAGPDFITKNKQYLKFGSPKKTYQQLYSQKKDTHIQSPPLNPNNPLPSISRENSQDASEVTNTWADRDDDMWTRQLVEEQKQISLLMRGHSDANVLSGMPHDASNNVRNSYGTQSSWSADHATAYARMQAQQQNQPPRTKVMFDDDMYNSFESDQLNLKSPRGQFNSHPNSKRTSPYPTLPGIPSQKKGGQSPLRTSDPDGYLVKLQKTKQKPQYKEYTLKDYRNLKKDMKLGGLGPDAELVAEKQEKLNRQRNYAKTVMEQNKKVLVQNSRTKPRSDKSITPTNRQPETPSRRNIAIEYAKNIPKPRVPTPPDQIHDRLYGSSSRQQQEDHQEAVAMEMARLEELKARHMKEKEEVDKLRTEIPT